MPDGLPILPPTVEAVEKMILACGMDPRRVVASIPPLLGEATVEKIAINAVMAGCLPQYLPVIVAAVEAMADESFNLTFSQATTHPSCPLLIVNGPLARTLVAPVGPMAVTHDGRVFGFCGTEMAKMFGYNPRTREATNLGVAVSVLERRRYGYVFGDAVTGRDGQIIFGEDDDLGHLWLYFPRIQAPA